MAFTATLPATDTNGVGIHQSGSPLYILLESDTTGTPYARAFAQFTVLAPMVVGTTLTINGVVYTASNDPGASQFMASSHVISPTPAIIARDLCNRLNADTRLNRQYIFDCSGALIQQGAINEGTQSDITIAFDPPTAFTLNSNVPGQDQYTGSAYPDYRVYARVEYNTFLTFPGVTGFSTGWRLAAVLERDFQQDNQHYLDLSGSLSRLVRSEPPSTVIGFQYKDSRLLAYRVAYGESYTPATVTNRVSFDQGQSNVFWVNHGALPTLTENDLTDYYEPGTRQWLTYRPSGAKCRVDSLLYMYFMYYDAVPASGTKYLAISISVTFMDGTTADGGRRFIASAKEGVIGVRVDPESWNMSAFELANSKPVDRYSIGLVQSSSPAMTSFSVISDPHVIVIDRKCERYEAVNLVWLEPIGGYSAYSFNGDRVTEATRSPQQFDKSQLPATQSASEFTQATAKVNYSKSVEANSGAIDRQTYEWLRDSLLPSPQVYIAIDGILQAVNIIAHTAREAASDNIMSMSITYVIAQPYNSLTQ